MITDLLTKLFKWYNSDKYFSEFYPQHDDKNTNNVTVTVHTADVTHADEITNVIITSHHITLPSTSTSHTSAKTTATD